MRSLSKNAFYSLKLAKKTLASHSSALSLADQKLLQERIQNLENSLNNEDDSEIQEQLAQLDHLIEIFCQNAKELIIKTLPD